MNNQVLIIGLNESDMKNFPEITAENAVFEDKIGIVQLRTSQQTHTLLKKLEAHSNIKAYPSSKFHQILNTKDKEYTPLHEFEPRDFVDFQFSGNEQFIVLNNDNFSVFELQNKDLEKIGGFPTTSNCVVSGDGVFLCFYNKNELEIRAGSKLWAFNRVFLEDEITDITFSPDSKYMAIFTRRGVDIWDIFKGDALVSQKGMQGSLIFEADLVHFPEKNKSFSLISGKEVKSDEKYLCVKKMRQYGNQTIAFTDNKIQKIQHTIDGHITSKTHANIEKIDFYFSEERCFALIVKSIQKDKVYFLESYSRDGITLTQLTGTIEQLEVSTNFFIAVDSRKNISFYSKDKFGFNKIKEIKKEDDVLIALYDNICCIHDSDTENIEFYDNGELKNVYSHQSCNNIQWSHSGLYVASISAGANSSGLVQMFNRNGKLLWKKIFNKLSACVWRPFTHISAEEKAKALEGFDQSAVQSIEENENATINVDELLSRWKSYLLSKKQRILARK